MLDSIVKAATSVVAGPLAPVVSSVLSGPAKLEQIAKPFTSIFPEVQSQFTTPFSVTPLAFRAPVLTSKAGDLLKSFGNLDAKEAEAMQLLQSDKFGDQVAGQQLFQKIQRSRELVLSVINAENELQKKMNQALT